MMKIISTLIVLILPFFLFAESSEIWYKIKYNTNNQRLLSYIQEGIIEADLENPETGWIKENNYQKYGSYFDFQKIDENIRTVMPLTAKMNPDSIGQVLEIYSLPATVQSVRGLTFDGQYFYIADADINNEKIHQLDPNNNFNVVNSFISPGFGSLLPWGLACDGDYIYIADGIQDAIFKTDFSGNIVTTFSAGGPLTTGLGHRAGELWNADLGDPFGYPVIPEKMFKMNTMGTILAQFNIPNTINGVAGNDSVVFIGRNKNNGEDIHL